MIKNIEVKAISYNNSNIRRILRSKGADYKGKDHQVDTYFKFDNGRLKLRRGNIENALIHYKDISGPKQSNVLITPFDPKNFVLDELFNELFGILVVVNKEREIYFIGNVKFHLDNVKDLGEFVEIEAMDNNGTIERKKRLEQCKFYSKLFGIEKKDLVSCSYSDLLLNKQNE